MTPFRETILRAGETVSTVLARFRKRAELIFLSKRENARRALGRFELVKRKAKEAERLDRLRNPRNYQGR